MRVIVDCNIWISFLLGFQKDFMRKLLCSSSIDVYVCPQLIDEIRVVAGRPKFANKISLEDLNQLDRLISAFCIKSVIKSDAVSNIRDVKDLYLLSLAETIEADYIVSGDKDLTDLKSHKNTQILSISEFKKLLFW